MITLQILASVDVAGARYVILLHLGVDMYGVPPHGTPCRWVFVNDILHIQHGDRTSPSAPGHNVKPD
jgi:hypothetical protein